MAAIPRSEGEGSPHACPSSHHPSFHQSPLPEAITQRIHSVQHLASMLVMHEQTLLVVPFRVHQSRHRYPDETKRAAVPMLLEKQRGRVEDPVLVVDDRGKRALADR